MLTSKCKTQIFVHLTFAYVNKEDAEFPHDFVISNQFYVPYSNSHYTELKSAFPIH